MLADVERWVSRCDICGRCRDPNPTRRAPLVPNEPGEPFGRLCVDILGPLLPTKHGHRFILVMIDAFTKWTEAVPLKKHTARDVATAILHQWASPS